MKISEKKWTNAGLLVVRLGVGASMAYFHGYGKLTGGAELWAKVGAGMKNFGIDFFPTFWGFMAAFSEFFGSILLILGLAFRPAAALLAFTMFVAVNQHLGMPPDSPSAGWKGAAHALELLAVYLGLLLAGPGRFRISSRLG